MKIYFYLIINVKKIPECCHPGISNPREKKSTYCKISTMPPSFDKMCYWVMPMVPSSLDVWLGLPGVS
jgi:hypothetical protein